MNRRENLKTLVIEASTGGLTFPTSAAAAMRVRTELDDPDCATDLVARLIQAEPLLAARAVALANSVAYNRSGRLITDVRSAVNLLGFRTLKTLATVMIARQMAAAAMTPEHRALSAKLWNHSAHVAALAQMLARRVTHQDPETAMFAGMLHEIGGFYLIYRAKDFPGVLEGDSRDWTGMGSPTDDERDEHCPERDIGRAVLTALAVPAPVVEAIEVLWKGYLAFPPASIGDTLLLAYELSPIKSPLREAGANDTDGPMNGIDMIIEQNTLHQILEDSAAEVTSLVHALSV